MLNEKSSLFKLFLSDVGMLTTSYGRAAKLALLSNDRKANFGAVWENVVAQELKAHGFQLYYYNSKKFGEIDFLVELYGKALPIEVKSGKDYQRHSALSNLMTSGGGGPDEALVLSEGNVKVEGRIVYYPIYMLMFIRNEIRNLPRVDMERLLLDDGR